MAWVKVDEKFPRGPKVKRAALALGGKYARTRVLGIWLDAMGYCNSGETDGFIPDYEVAEMNDPAPRKVFEAMAEGESPGPMVVRDDDRHGWVIRNYATYQPTKSELEAQREKDRLRKRNKRDVSRRTPDDVRADKPRTPEGQIPDSETTDPDRSRPDRSEPDREVPRAARATPPSSAMGGSHTLVNGPSQRRHGQHARCYESRGLCVTPWVWEEMLGRIGGAVESRRDRLKAFCDGEILALGDLPVGDPPDTWWRKRLAHHLGVDGMPAPVGTTKGSRTVAAASRVFEQVAGGAVLDAFGALAAEAERDAELALVPAGGPRR